ncbi:type II secretion system protein GspM [Neptunomonas sp.]|jgi:MSHA biogenesis protein MshJ|uniref:type II secretion system protein GspM n=1 Tax=Neptunomonas TaxID=75687 RepID=UPI0035196EF5
MSTEGVTTIESWRQKFNALTPRERVLIAGTMVVLVVVLLFLLVIEPKQKAIQSSTQRITQQQQAIKANEASLVILNRALSQDPSAPIRLDIDDLVSQDLAMSSRIANESAKLVDPTQMSRVLEAVLDQSSDLRLLSLQTLPVQRLDITGQPSSDNAGAASNTTAGLSTATETPIDPVPVYEHAFELKVSGSYAAVYTYLHRLEQLSQAFFWDALELNVKEYPTTEVTLRIHTLSGEEGWLGG